MNRTVALLPLVAMSFVTAGCDAPADRVESGAWTVDSVPALVINDATAEGQGLYMVNAALRLPDGRVVIANDGSRELRAYDSTGTLVWRTGREGGGPGDFGRLMDLDRKGDTLFVWDNRNERLTRVSTDGEYLGSTRFQQPGESPVSGRRMAGILGDTAVVLYQYWFYTPAPGPATLVWDSAPNLLYGLDGRLLDTLGFSGIQQSRGPERHPPPLIWGHRSFHAVGDGRFYRGDGQVEIRYHTGAGTQGVIPLGRERKPVTEEERRAWIDERMAGLPESSTAADRREARALYDGVLLPERKPAHGHLVVDDSGYLWVQEYRHLREYALPGPRQWTVIGPDGHHVTDLMLPDMEVQHIDEDFIVGWRLGDLDIEEVVVHRLNRGRT